MRGPALWFFLSAAIYVLAGMMFGIWMAATQDHSLAPAHGHLNLVGWVSMAIFGIYYHLVPSAGQSMLARVHFVLATLGVWILVPGIALAVQGRTEALAQAGSLLTLVAMLLFVVIVVRNRRIA